MLMAIGPFPFMQSTLPHQSARRSTEWRHPTQGRVDYRPASQFVGAGDETMTLSGVLMPEITGGAMSLDALRLLAAAGMAWPLIEGTGRILGLWVILAVEQTGTYLMADGAPQRIEFSVSLRRVDDWSELLTTTASNAIAAAL